MGVIDWIKDRHEAHKRACAYRKAAYMSLEAISDNQERQL